MKTEKEPFFNWLAGRGRWVVGIALGRDLWYVRTQPAKADSKLGEARVYMTFGLYVTVYPVMCVVSFVVGPAKLSLAWDRRP